MNNKFMQLKKWYEYRTTRERLFFLGLCWAFMYAFFSFFLFRPITNQYDNLFAATKDLKGKISSWNRQIEAVKKISDSPLYKKWLQEKQISNNIRGKYQDLLQTFSVNQWQDIIKTILLPQNNIRVVQIKNFPESTATPLVISGQKKIYQRKLDLVIYGQYFETLNYLNHLDQAFPNIHWDTFDYQVIQYPVAKVEMELSVYYEKKQ